MIFFCLFVCFVIHNLFLVAKQKKTYQEEEEEEEKYSSTHTNKKIERKKNTFQLYIYFFS